MKKLIIGLLLNIVLGTAKLSAQDTTMNRNTSPMPTGDNYCLTMKDGREVITTKGVVLNYDIVLRNGSLLRPNGTIIRKDGNRENLKEGQCIDQDGNIGPKQKVDGN